MLEWLSHCNCVQFIYIYICFIFFYKICLLTLFQKKQCILIYSDLFLTGDTVSVVAKISNSSSKKIRPKLRLQQEIMYRAGRSTNTSDQNLCKMVGDTIKVNSEETVSCQMKIPVDVTPTLCNCEIISVDYYLKVCNNNKYVTSTLVWVTIYRPLV